jgi:hypothetical protein
MRIAKIRSSDAMQCDWQPTTNNYFQYQFQSEHIFFLNAFFCKNYKFKVHYQSQYKIILLFFQHKK